MTFESNGNKLEIASDHPPKHTKLFVSMLLSMLDKGVDNPAFQLHIVSMLTAGKPFMELNGDEKEMEMVIETSKILMEEILKPIMEKGGHNMSGSTIDDILNNQ